MLLSGLFHHELIIQSSDAIYGASQFYRIGSAGGFVQRAQGEERGRTKKKKKKEKAELGSL